MALFKAFVFGTIVATSLFAFTDDFSCAYTTKYKTYKFDMFSGGESKFKDKMNECGKDKTTCQIGDSRVTINLEKKEVTYEENIPSVEACMEKAKKSCVYEQSELVESKRTLVKFKNQDQVLYWCSNGSHVKVFPAPKKAIESTASSAPVSAKQKVKN